MNQSELSPAKRIYYLDYLRVIATFAVMMIHISSKGLHPFAPTSTEFRIYIAYESMVRWPVDMFFMISGAVFLGRTISLKKLYGKYTLRIATAFVFWSILYVVVFPAGKWDSLLRILGGHYHMWFLFAIAGLYICQPLLKKFAESKQLMQYFLLLFVVFGSIFPHIVRLTHDFAGERAIALVDVLQKDLGRLSLSPIMGFAPFFVGGYYLYQTDIPKKVRTALYVLGAGSIVYTFVLTAAACAQQQKLVENYFDRTAPQVFLPSVALFVWFKYNWKSRPRLDALMFRLGKYSFGAYLVHAMVLGLGGNSFVPFMLQHNPLVTVPLVGFGIFGVSFAVSFVLNHIPVLNKYIV